MRPGTLVRLALAGTRTDLLRVFLTLVAAALAALAFLAAATVLSIPLNPANNNGDAGQYGNPLLREPGLRPGVAIALLMLTIPVLALAGQAARLGAPARDRRLAAYRLAGMTPGQTLRVAVAETGVASFAGALLALVAYLVARPLLHRYDERGALALPTDVLPAPGWLAAITLGIPLLAALTAALTLRKVTVTPLGVVRRALRSQAPKPWPWALILIGFAAFAAVQPLTLWYAGRNLEMPSGLVLALLFGGGLASTVGLVLGAGSLSYAIGRLLHRFGRGPATLLAARRMISDPWHGSRTYAALFAVLIFAGGAAGFRAYFETNAFVEAESQRQWDVLTGSPTAAAGVNDFSDFYLRTMDLVQAAVLVGLVIAVAGLLIAVAEGVAGRRRTYAALMASGVPRGVLGRSVAWQSLAVVVPATLLALGTGVTAVLGVFGDTVTGGGGGGPHCAASPEICADPAQAPAHTREIVLEPVVRAIPLPISDLLLYGGGTLAAVLLTVVVGALLIRSDAGPEILRTS
ncbi:FtsX-like permease family protein [Melissospora conviva]|uniref:FtsX-like permease family protein n=1 Tax=Melissospora conviva TaxID=3388432 RepID=UPI003C188CBA